MLSVMPIYVQGDQTVFPVVERGLEFDAGGDESTQSVGGVITAS